jgi:hypothetical protein
MSVASGTGQPPCGPPSQPGDGQIDEGRGDHAAQRGQHRGRQLAGIAELAAQDLVFDLQPDHEEEDRHQAFLDPVGDRLLEPQRADLEDVIALQPVEIVGRPGELATIRAATAARPSAAPEAVSVLRKSRVNLRATAASVERVGCPWRPVIDGRRTGFFRPTRGAGLTRNTGLISAFTLPSPARGANR